MILLSVPAMYDLTYIDRLSALNKKSPNTKISEVYGSIESSPLGTIRPSATLDQLDLNNLKKYIWYCRENSIQFDYIMNSTVLDGSEYTQEGRKKIIDFIGELVDAGIASLTLSVPFIIRLVRKNFPDLHITASICSEIDSIKRALEYQLIGVNRIVLAKDVNRNFGLINKIKDAFSGDIKLLATTPCTFKCSDIFYHMNLSSIRDNALSVSFKGPADVSSHTSITCQKYRLENPVEYIKSPWIRPEDMKFYNEIGISLFKLDGRDKPMEYNLEVIEAYINNEYTGNLLYLMQNYFPKNQEEYNQLNCKDSQEFWRLGVYIDNSKMDGFIDPFFNKNINCEDGCNACNYCNSWMKNALSTDTKNTYNYLKLLNVEYEKRLAIE